MGDIELSTTEKYVLAQLAVCGDLDEGEFRMMNEMNTTTSRKACRSLQDKGILGPGAYRENPMEKRW